MASNSTTAVSFSALYHLLFHTSERRAIDQHAFQQGINAGQRHQQQTHPQTRIRNRPGRSQLVSVHSVHQKEVRRMPACFSKALMSVLSCAESASRCCKSCHPTMLPGLVGALPDPSKLNTLGSSTYALHSVRGKHFDVAICRCQQRSEAQYELTEHTSFG